MELACTKVAGTCLNKFDGIESEQEMLPFIIVML
ncbi:hypothetical protein VITU9109_22336 [Vibrio tubiashii ATCC 19109]|uniref:Uncharacterized protein n=1 Tax=Vibrio tubiashii ATCC 19109 TaxID=1051646 RepID=A0ABN0DDH4_9VIBR|nr:hypothetical protein VITU9109_22336 [Vibrio tubiashii ATCC 19109]